MGDLDFDVPLGNVEQAVGNVGLGGLTDASVGIGCLMIVTSCDQRIITVLNKELPLCQNFHTYYLMRESSGLSI